MEKKEQLILKCVYAYCENECPIRESCVEYDCVLFRIEKIVLDKN